MKSQETHNLTQAEMLRYLIEKGYIRKGTLYRNVRKIPFEKYLKINQLEESYMWITLLIKKIPAPMLFDGIIDVGAQGEIDKSKRRNIRLALYKHDKGKLNFYESNILQASNLADYFTIISKIGGLVPISIPLIGRFEELKHRLCSGERGQYAPDKYIRNFSIIQKMKAAFDFRKLAEDVLLEVFKHYGL
jgi:hypothetical protein